MDNPKLSPIMYYLTWIPYRITIEDTSERCPKCGGGGIILDNPSGIFGHIEEVPCDCQQQQGEASDE